MEKTCANCRWFIAWPEDPDGIGYCERIGGKELTVADACCEAWEPIEEPEEGSGLRRASPRPEDQELVAHLTRAAANGVGILF